MDVQTVSPDIDFKDICAAGEGTFGIDELFGNVRMNRKGHRQGR